MIQGRQGERVWGHGGPGHVRPGYVVTDLSRVRLLLSLLLTISLVLAVSQSRRTAVARRNRVPRPGRRVAVHLAHIL